MSDQCCIYYKLRGVGSFECCGLYKVQPDGGLYFYSTERGGWIRSEYKDINELRSDVLSTKYAPYTLDSISFEDVMLELL